MYYFVYQLYESSHCFSVFPTQFSFVLYFVKFLEKIVLLESAFLSLKV